MTFCLASCGGKDSSSVQGENAPVSGETDSPQAEKSLVLGETASVAEYADFTLVSNIDSHCKRRRQIQRPKAA